jgi:membrane protein
MWLFLTSYVILLGAELDAEMERQTVRDTTDDPEKPLGQRGAHAADTVGAALGKRSAHHG